jgi:hypothetical protein
MVFSFGCLQSSWARATGVAHVPIAGAHDVAAAIVAKIDFQIENVPADGT